HLFVGLPEVVEIGLSGIWGGLWRWRCAWGRWGRLRWGCQRRHINAHVLPEEEGIVLPHWRLDQIDLEVKVLLVAPLLDDNGVREDAIVSVVGLPDVGFPLHLFQLDRIELRVSGCCGAWWHRTDASTSCGAWRGHTSPPWRY